MPCEAREYHVIAREYHVNWEGGLIRTYIWSVGTTLVFIIRAREPAKTFQAWQLPSSVRYSPSTLNERHMIKCDSSFFGKFPQNKL